MRDKTQVPEGWELSRVDSLLEQLAEVRGDLEPEPIVLSCSKDLGLVPQTELFKRRLASTDTRRYKIVHPGDFVYDPNLLWSGAITRSREQALGIVSPIYEVFRAARGCSRDFLFAWLTSPRRLPAYRAISMGTNLRRRRAGFDDFSKLPIQLPPLAEQRAIAAVLDSIDEAIERTEAVIAAMSVCATPCSTSCSRAASPAGTRSGRMRRASGPSRPAGTWCGWSTWRRLTQDVQR